MDDDRIPYEALPTVALTPEAEEVNTFIQPQKPQDLTPNMDSLAKGLSDFDQGLGDFLDAREKQQDVSDKVNAEADAYKSNAQGYAMGVQNGSILAQHSPAYVQTYKQTQGLIAGDTLQQQFDQQYQAAGGGAMDSDAFNAFRQKFITDNIQTTDKDVLTGLMPTMRKMTLTSEHRYQTDRDAYLKSQANAASGAALNQTIDTAHTDGALNPTGTDTQGLYGKIVAQRNTWLTNGQEPGFGDKGIDKNIVDRVAAMAIQNRDPNTLAVLNNPVPGQSYTYAESPYGQEKMKEAQSTLATLNNKDAETAYKIQQHQDETQKNSLLARGFQAAAADPHHPVPQGIVDALTDPNHPLEPDAAKKFADFQETLIKSNGVQDPDQDIAVQQAIMNGGGMQAVLDARDQGHITSPEAYTRLSKLADDYQKNRSTVDTITNDPTYKGWQKLIAQRAGTGKIDPTDPLSPMGQTPESLGLTAKMNVAMMNWAVTHPGATPQDRQAAIDQIGNLYVSSIQSDGINHTLVPVDQQRVDSITGVPTAATPFAGKGTPGSMAAPAAPPQAPAAPAPAAAPAGAPAVAPPAPEAPAATDPNGIPQQQQPPVITPQHIQQAVSALTNIGGGGDIPATPRGRLLTPQPQDAPAEAVQPQQAPAAPTTAPAQGTPPAAPAAAPGASPAGGVGQDFKDPAVGAFYNDFTPAQRNAMQTMAAAHGVPVESIVKQAYDTAIAHGHVVPSPGDAVVPGTPQSSSPQQAPVTVPQKGAEADPVGQSFDKILQSENTPVAPDVQRQVANSFDNILQAKDADRTPTGGYKLATINNDPKAAHILDFVAGAELNQEHAGNYNAYYGHAGSGPETGGPDLSQMSMAQIGQFMKTRGTTSSATGRYQFMYKTLFGDPSTGAPGLVKRMGLSMDTKFTPVVQDTMAMQLMRDAGYDSWRQGKMSQGTFANNLAGIWASLPLEDGLSRYQGDKAGNKALVSRPALNAALGGPNDMGSQTPAITPTGTTPTDPQNVYAAGGNNGPRQVYANVPDTDSAGRPGQKAKFLAWNPDPVGQNDKNIKSLQPDLQAIVQQAQLDNPGMFVAASGKRTQKQEVVAVKNGWAPGSFASYRQGFAASESKHKDGSAVDLWPLDENGRVTFDPDRLRAVSSAMKAAAVKVGKSVKWGGDFTHRKDLPHYELD